MKRFMFTWCLLGSAIMFFPSSCGTVYRYEYYDHEGKTIDERHDDRLEKMNRHSRGILGRRRYPGRYR